MCPSTWRWADATAAIVGKDVLWESSRECYELADLGFGRCRLVLAAPRDSGLAAGVWPQSLRVATKYPVSARRFFAARSSNVVVIRLHGSVELAPLTGLPIACSTSPRQDGRWRRTSSSRSPRRVCPPRGSSPTTPRSRRATTRSVAWRSRSGARRQRVPPSVPHDHRAHTSRPAQFRAVIAERQRDGFAAGRHRPRHRGSNWCNSFTARSGPAARRPCARSSPTCEPVATPRFASGLPDRRRRRRDVAVAAGGDGGGLGRPRATGAQCAHRRGATAS